MAFRGGTMAVACALLLVTTAGAANSSDAGTDTPLVLSNGRTSLAFQGAASGFALASIRSAAATGAGDNFLVAPGQWWSVDLVLPGNLTAQIASGSACASRSHTLSPQALALRWRGVRLPGSGGGAVDVAALRPPRGRCASPRRPRS